jgi:DNA-binding NtrC family response regulator
MRDATRTASSGAGQDEPRVGRGIRLDAWSDITVSKERPARAAVRARAGRLSIVFPRALAAAYAIDRDAFVLGRRGDGQVRHPTVSRTHVEIVWNADVAAYVARDLDSRNGSALDGLPLGAEPRLLVEGSVLRMGDVVAVWESPAATADERDCLEVSEEIPGRAASVQALRAAIGRAATDHAPVLIIGETGAGKERVARELHRLSGRTGPLVSINCAALAPSLVESQLFGHSRGAFTGALEAQRGLFREAHGGSLLLDEIGELPTTLQAKLLRAIQEREVRPIGGADPVAVDVRVIAATHRKPAEAIAAGLLREDLFARLSLWELHVPALRARRVDLYDWLVRMHAIWQRSGAPSAFPQLSVDTVEALLLQRWPLNLRALERLVRELATRCQGRLIEPCDLPDWLDATLTAHSAPTLPAEPLLAPSSSGGHPRPPLSTDAAATSLGHPRPPLPSRDEFVAAFEQLGGSVRALAGHFGRERRQIYRWIEAHGVRS